jgi:hypothetical protein
VRIATGFGSVIIGLKASIIRSQNPVVVLIVLPPEASSGLEGPVRDYVSYVLYRFMLTT